MDEGRADLLMQVEGMSCDGCAVAVARTVRRVDPTAIVEVDRASGRVAIRSVAQALTLADALTKAGYPATATAG